MKLTNEQMGKITNFLNSGLGDSWNKNYGIFRPMKEYTAKDWIQFCIISIFYVIGWTCFIVALDDWTESLCKTWTRKKERHFEEEEEEDEDVRACCRIK